MHESMLGSFQSYDISFHVWPVVVCLIIDVLTGKKPPSRQILYMQRIQSHEFVVSGCFMNCNQSLLRSFVSFHLRNQVIVAQSHYHLMLQPRTLGWVLIS